MLVLLIGTAASGQTDWTQFRGPQGRAITTGPLPERCDPSSRQLLWKVPVPGFGISSPIVSKGKVIVTSAYPSLEQQRTRELVRLGTLGLCALSVLGVWFAWRPRRHETGRLAWLDRSLLPLVTIGFGAAVAVVTLWPHKLFVPGIPGDTWLVTATIGLVGVFAAGCCLPVRHPLRLLVVALLIAAAIYAWQSLPLNKHHQVYKLPYRLAMTAPGALGAVWHLLVFFTGRGRPPHAAASLLAGLSVIATTALMFWNHNVFMPRNGPARAVLAYDLRSGTLLWDTPLFSDAEERLHRKNSFATPTACASTDGSKILCYFGPGWACVDHDGRKLWEGRDDGYFEQSHYGAVSSPIAYEDTFLLLHDTERTERKTSFVMALDMETGKERWRKNPHYAHECYMTPSIVPVAGKAQLVRVAFSRVVGYDPTNGTQLWNLELPTWQHAPSLTYDGDLLFVSGGAHEKWVTAAIRLGGAAQKPEVVWQSRRMVPHSASPVVIDGLLFTVTGDGILVCYDAASGQRHWQKRLGATCLSSLVAGDGKVVICTEEGEVIIVAANKDGFREMSRCNLGEAIQATPAVSDGRLLIRSKAHLWCFAAR